MTSSVCVPIEPVEPSRTTLVVVVTPRSADLELNGEVEDRGQAEEDRVEAVEDATVAREDGAEVLDAEVALDHRLAEVAERRHDRDDGAEGEAVRELAVPRRQAQAFAHDPAEDHRRSHAAEEPLP